ncbi:zinc finger CCCH domain-containing protein 10-like [Watersipora subatra]|uniref:zinc finger CCCH domain-containing protein 10-like n=1 Tax=Watersipora subatra TaxID=2589382 RepID=UPI00355B59BE
MEETNGQPEKNKEECRDFKRNVCTKGDNCKYYHPPKDANSIFERNSVCHDFQNLKGCNRESCKFLHLTKEQEEYIRTNGTCPPSLSQQEMDKIIGLPPFCNDFIRGTCTRGASCKFRHVGDPGAARGMGRGGPMFEERAPERFDPYRRPFPESPYDRMEMKRRYREDMMEDEIMYLRAQVGRLKRQIADFAATNESLMDENARLRLEVDRKRAAAPIHETTTARLTAVASAPQEYNLTQTRSAYPYTSGIKLDAGVTPVAYPTAPF